MILDGDHQRAWKDGEKRDSKLVFIGRQLPEEKIRKGFETVVCLSHRLTSSGAACEASVSDRDCGGPSFETRAWRAPQDEGEIDP